MCTRIQSNVVRFVRSHRDRLRVGNLREYITGGTRTSEGYSRSMMIRVWDHPGRGQKPREIRALAQRCRDDSLICSSTVLAPQRQSDIFPSVFSVVYGHLLYRTVPMMGSPWVQQLARGSALRFLGSIKKKLGESVRKSAECTSLVLLAALAQ